jgi:hypothetical protein
MIERINYCAAVREGQGQYLGRMAPAYQPTVGSSEANTLKLSSQYSGQLASVLRDYQPQYVPPRLPYVSCKMPKIELGLEGLGQAATLAG